MKKRIILFVIIVMLTAAGCSTAATNSENNESVLSSQILSGETDTNTIPDKTSTPNTQEPEISVTNIYTEEDSHMPLTEKLYQTPDITSVSPYFVHKKVGSGLDMELYLELLDKETDGLYCTVKNNKNVWRVVTVSACGDPNEDDYITAYEKFALAPNEEVVVKLTLNAEKYKYIKELSFGLFCNGLNYSAAEQTADINGKEPDLMLNYFLYVWRQHEAVPIGKQDEPTIDLTEGFIRGFGTWFFTPETHSE